MPLDDRHTVHKGRGATFNPKVRFESTELDPFDDGWDSLAQARADDPPPQTEVMPDSSRSVIVRNTSPDIPFDRSINPYRGCEHGCVYCYARPTHAYLGLSPGLDFETRLLAKFEAASLLERELARPGYACQPIALGTNTDPYQPVERRLRITRGVLEVLARRLEPRAAAPHRRLQAIRQLSEAGVPTAVMVAPIIPALTDHEMEGIVEAAAAAGASSAGYVLLRLPHEVKELFEDWLPAPAPGGAPPPLSPGPPC